MNKQLGRVAANNNSKLVFAVATSLLILIVSLVAIAHKHSPAAERRKVFEQAWRVVGEKFYDRTMSGLDWLAIRKNFEQKLGDTKSTNDLYWKVISPMLALLESSHVVAVSPDDATVYSGQDLPMAAMPASNLESCGGLMTTFFQRHISSRVVSVGRNSPLASLGIQSGWRFLGASNPDEHSSVPGMVFMSPEGAQVTFKTRQLDGSIDVTGLEKELLSLAELRVKEVDPVTEVRIDSLGLIVTAGKVLRSATVADVVKGSEAERAGVEPGSIITHLHRKNGADGNYTVEAKLISPSGSPYSASFVFRMCDVPDRSAVLLPGNVLLLRFNSFQADVVPWLDSQLRQKPDAVVLDLRRNGGGSATAMLEILGRFVDAGSPISEVIRADGAETFRAASTAHSFRGPVAVLIGSLSASAAEVTASALRFHNRARLYGTRTTGNVLLSNSFRLLDGGIIQVAIADMRGPDGKRIENVGVKPDYEIMPTLETVRAGRDVVLEAALTDLKQTLH